MVVCLALPGWASTRRNIHPLTPILIIDHPLSVLPPSTMVHNMLRLQFTCLTLFLYNLSPSHLWFTSWFGPLHFILHTFLHPLLSFSHNTYNLFCCSTKIMSSNPSLSLSSLLGTLSFVLTSHIRHSIFAHQSATSFFFVTNQVSLPCHILVHTQVLYSLPLFINDISLSVSNGTYSLNLFRPIWILASTAASASTCHLNSRTSTNSRFSLALMSTLVRPLLVIVFQQPLQINDYHFGHATFYTTTLIVYPLMTTSTLYWITTDTCTTDTTWPTCNLLH